ncbi:double-strand-break repair protein rad21-like protein 1 isoform X3 [Opisthocomus hoazin]|uniref:double-strand-break repair protein rad21-like protein 1 isoform X3 n=1 Tax=Opisthocomus hoazin TaxID=30419 RepID=UPI003F53D882
MFLMAPMPPKVPDNRLPLRLSLYLVINMVGWGLAIDVAEHFTLNQSSAEDITLTEDYESDILLCDRNFDEEPDAVRKQSFFDSSILTSSNSLVADCNSASVNGDKSALCEDAYCFQHDCFGDEEEAVDMIEILLRDEQNGLDKDMPDMEEERPLSQDPPENSMAIESKCADTTMKKVSYLAHETVLFSKEEEGFVLEPVDDTAVTQRKKNKRKRKLLVDVDKELSCNAIYKQLNNCVDILAALDLAPPTKKTMMWKKWGGVDKLLTHAAQPVVHAELQMLFAKCFKMRRNGIQKVSEKEETRKEQATTEMLAVEEPSYLQESAHLETERKIRDDSFMLTSQNNRNETDDNCGETIHDGRAFSESSSLANNSLGQEAETQQAELTNELTRNGKDGEEIRWSNRTLQLLNTLQHLQRSGVRSFSLRELCRKNSRKEAAAKFYLLLVLKKQSVIELSQSAPFADITATLGPMFSAR